MTKVEIVNIALTRLGQQRITSLDDASKPARSAKAIYDAVRDEVLRSHPWNFAIKRKSLARLDEEVAFGYSYVYELPSDCLRVLEVEGEDDWQVEGRKLLTNATSVKIRYIARIEDPNLYDSAFVYAFALRLACELANDLVGSSSIVKQLWDEYLFRIGMAMALDGQEGTGQIEFDSTWTKVR